MPFEFDSIYLVYVLVAVSAALFFEGIYLLCFTGASYRTHVNRRLKLLRNVTSRESLLIQLRRERGLTRSGDFAIGIESLNRLVVQSGVTMGPKKLIITIVVSALLAFGATLSYQRDLVDALIAGVACGTLLPYLVLLYLRGRRRNKFGAQFADGLDMIVRSLRAGHPVPIAINMVAREMPDPIGSEFGIITDEITYGADLETALRNLNTRLGQADLPLFVTAVAIQGSTGGNLGEILQNLSTVIRDRFKMRRKIRALAAEGRTSALILASLPFFIFAAVHLSSPNFYGAVWHLDLTKKVLLGAGMWMSLGLVVMYRMVNFKI